MSFWPHFFLQTSRFFRIFLDLSGFGFLRLACGTAFSSVHNILSVFFRRNDDHDPENGKGMANAIYLEQSRLCSEMVCKRSPHPSHPKSPNHQHSALPHLFSCLVMEPPQFQSERPRRRTRFPLHRRSVSAGLSRDQIRNSWINSLTS